MASLYEIDERIEELTERMIDPETGEINEQVEKELDDLQMEKEAKIEYLALLVKNIRSDVVALKAEKESFDSRIKTSTNKADRIEAYIGSILRGEKFETSKAKISWRKSQKVEVVKESIIPDEYMKYETTGKPVKSLIKDALKEGKNVPGAKLVESQNISIK